MPDRSDFSSQRNDKSKILDSAGSRQVKLMEEARRSGSVCSKELGILIYGSKEQIDKTIAAFERVGKVLGNDTFKLPPAHGGLSQKQMMLDGLRGGKATFQDGIKHNDNTFDWITHLYGSGNQNPFGLTHTLFVPFLKLMGTEEQVEFWLPLAESGQIIGSYAQTEMGHGSHVGGVETTATLDCKTDNFVIHSPSLTSAKYWPGALSLCSSHTIAMARLIIDDKDFGVHPFMIQLRSLYDFKPLPGVQLGDIGPKAAYNTTDNGYAMFDHVRIPRTNLLSRYAAVSSDGEYNSDPLRDKILYGGMLYGRVIIFECVGFQLAQTATIASRYSVVREQGSSLSEDPHSESAIIAYKHQHYRLLTIISQAYATIFSTQRCRTALLDLLAHQKNGDHSTLPSVHALMCGLKAWSTQTAADGAEQARQLCGGHGYLSLSGIPQIVASLSGACTYEGENWVMWNQVARYLMKGMDAAVLPTDMEYINLHDSMDQETCGARGKKFLNFSVLIDIFKHRAARLIRGAHTKLNGEIAKGISRAKAMNKFGLDMMVAARAHIELFILEAGIYKLDLVRNTTSAEAKAVLNRLIALFALTTMASPFAPYTATFIGVNYLSSTQIREITGMIDDLLQELLPEVIVLTDAFGFTDGCLNSVLGCKDGDIYRRLKAWTRQLPLNVEVEKNDGVFKEGWEQYIKPFLDENKEIARLRARSKL